jgi:WD40 repeat protein
MYRKSSYILISLALCGGCSNSSQQHETTNPSAMTEDSIKTDPVVLVGHTDAVVNLAWLPDGRRILTCGADCTIRLWDSFTGQELRKYSGHQFNVRSLAVLSGGTTFASGSQDGTVRLWNVDSDQAIAVYKLHSAGSTGEMAMSPDGKTLIVCDLIADTKLIGLVVLLDPANLSVKQTFKDDRFPELGLPSFSPDGHLLVTTIFSDLDPAIDLGWIVWNVESGKVVKFISVGRKIADSATFSPDGKTLLTTCQGHLRIWDTINWAERNSKSPFFAVGAIAWAPDGKTFAAGGFMDSVIICDSQTQKQIRSLGFNFNIAAGAGITGLAFSPNGERLAAGESDTNLTRIWKVSR